MKKIKFVIFFTFFFMFNRALGQKKNFISEHDKRKIINFYENHKDDICDLYNVLNAFFQRNAYIYQILITKNGVNGCCVKIFFIDKKLNHEHVTRYYELTNDSMMLKPNEDINIKEDNSLAEEAFKNDKLNILIDRFISLNMNIISKKRSDSFTSFGILRKSSHSYYDIAIYLNSNTPQRDHILIEKNVYIISY